MIVFIAVIITASVSAGLLMNTAFYVQEQADATGDAAVNNVGTVFLIADVVGDRGSAQGGDILDLQLKLSMAAGSADIAMQNVIIEVSTDDVEVNLRFDYGSTQEGYQHQWNDYDAADAASLAGAADASSFTYTAMEIRDTDDSFYTTGTGVGGPDYIVSQGCLIKVFVDLTGATIGNQQTFNIKIIPKHGVPTTFTGTTPEAFTDRYVPF